jgi:hypothetical protein
MDRDFTRHIRDTVEANGIYYGNLYTEAEVDALLDMDIEDTVNPNLPTEAAEELIYRTTGIQVELAAQGAASLTLGSVKDGRFDSRNTLTMIKSELRTRVYDPGHPDTWLVPPRTRDDANLAVSSINFPQRKISGTPLDNLRIDTKDNPAEKALSNALSFAQALHGWGADVAEFCGVVDKVFGISYAMALIEKCGYAETADLDEYLATGGRPPPQVNMSPNRVSQFITRDRPMYAKEDVGAASIFAGRSQELARFISVFTNMCHGDGYQDLFKFQINRAQFSMFDPSVFKGVKLRTDVKPRPSDAAASIADKGTIDSYIRARQAARVAFKTKERTLIKTLGLFRARKAVTAVWLGAAQPMHVPGSKDIMQIGLPKYKPADPIHQLAVPTRVNAIAHAICHRTDRDDYVATLDATAIVSCYTSASCENIETFSTRWNGYIAVQGFARSMDAINLSDVTTIAEFEALVKSADDQKLVGRVAVYHRACMHSTVNVREAISMIDASSTGRDMPKKFGSPRKYRIGKYPRVLRLVYDGARGNPYSAIRSASGQLHGRVATKGVVDIDAEQAARMFNKAEAEVARSKSKHTKFSAYLRIATQGVRDTWANFYYARARSRLSLLYAMIPGNYRTMSLCVDDIQATLTRNADDRDYGKMAIAGLAVEIMVDLAGYLAYKFASISLLGFKTAPDADKWIESYKKWLSTSFKAEVGFQDSISIDLHTEKFGSKSAIVKELGELAEKIAPEADNLPSAKIIVELMIKEFYVTYKDKVSLSLGEMLRKDKSVLTRWDDVTYADDRKVPATPEAPTATTAEVVDAIMSVADTAAVLPGRAYSDEIRLVKALFSVAARAVSSDDEVFRNSCLYMNDYTRLQTAHDMGDKVWAVTQMVANAIDTADRGGNDMAKHYLSDNGKMFWALIVKKIGFDPTSGRSIMEGP